MYGYTANYICYYTALQASYANNVTLIFDGSYSYVSYYADFYVEYANNVIFNAAGSCVLLSMYLIQISET